LEEERIRSALEIALERVSRMPELTPAEVAAQKEKEYGPVGAALGNRFLEGFLAAGEIKAELARHPGELGRIVRRACLAQLCGSLAVDDPQRTRRAMEGIRALQNPGGAFFEEAEQEMQSLLDGFEREAAAGREKAEAGARQALADLGVSGPALRPNLASGEFWGKEVSRILRAFEPRLQELRSRLMS